MEGSPSQSLYGARLISQHCWSHSTNFKNWDGCTYANSKRPRPSSIFEWNQLPL